MRALPIVDKDRRPNTTTIHDLDWYDWFLEDSIALALSLLKKGVPRCRPGRGHGVGRLEQPP